MSDRIGMEFIVFKTFKDLKIEERNVNERTIAL